MHVVDAFTNEQFKGNSAAIIVIDSWLDDDLMQSIAVENNLSETAFLVQNDQGVYHIRWFSPITEIDFCGHATLASAHVLFSKDNAPKSLTFFAKAVGEMTIIKNAQGRIEMDFPNRKPVAIVDKDVPEALYKGLSIAPQKVLKNEQAYFAIFEDEHAVQTVTQQPELLKKLAPLDVVVTAKGSQFDFVSRYFWPANGGDEDPVTGSIHTGLAPYWAEQLDKNILVAKQASARTGVLFCEVNETRVKISGDAVLYLVGEISV